MACIVCVSVSVRTAAPCSICLFGVCPCCLPVLTWTNLSAGGCLLALLSGLHSLQQLQAGASSMSPVQMSPSTRESHGAATSSSVSCPQVTHSTISPQVQTGPTRTVTSDLLSATLAEAATQLSFAAFLERCIFVNASPPPQLPVPTPISGCCYADFFTHTAASRDVSTHLSFREFLASPSMLDVLCPACARPVPSLLLDAAVKTLLYRVASHDASTQLPLTSSLSGASSPMTL